MWGIMSDMIEVTYDFQWTNGAKEQFKLSIYSENHQIAGSFIEIPKWTELEYEQCEHCTLKNSDSIYCPVAIHLDRVVKSFSAYKSHHEVNITVTTKDRAYVKFTSLQVGLQSIFGLIMATSGCPYLKFLKPMAHFHLPFANLEETVSRSISFYLLKQYFVARKGETPDWELKGLDEAYSQITQVNQGLAARIGRMKSEFEKGSGDASPNAIVILDSFAQLLSMEISSELSSISPIFAAQ
jgi:hypothetical protein